MNLKCCQKLVKIFCSKQEIKTSYTKLTDLPLQINNKNKNFLILQPTDTEEFLPQGNINNLPNYDIMEKFLNKPLVKIYINEVFRPNKNIKEFHYPKIRGIFDEIKPEFDELFNRFQIEYEIIKKDLNIDAVQYKLSCSKPTLIDLDRYLPIFFLELCLYPKSFMLKSKIKKIYFAHEINYKTYGLKKPQYRAGCPETNVTQSLIFSASETNFLYIRIVLHHELFHFIDWTDDYSYDDPEWKKLNIPHFKYGKGGDSEREWIPLEKNKRGFINHYSTTDLAEDRAEIYQYLMGCPDESLNHKDHIVQLKARRMKKLIINYDPEGIGNKDLNFFGNLMEFRKKFVYREKNYQGNVDLV